MITTEFNLSILILSMLNLGIACASEFSNQVDRLHQSQQTLDDRISPFRALSGFRSSDSENKSVNREKESPIFHIHNSFSNLQAPVGKLLFGKIYNRLVIGSDKSPVIVVLNDGQKSFSGLRAIGTAIQSSTSGRVSIEIQKIIFRSGIAQTVSGLVLDTEGALGLTAQVISQKALTVAGALASSFVSGLASSQQSVTSNAFGFESTQRSPRNALLGGLAQTAADQSKRLIEESTSEKPVLILEANTEVSIMLQEEVRF